MGDVNKGIWLISLQTTLDSLTGQFSGRCPPDVWTNLSRALADLGLGAGRAGWGSEKTEDLGASTTQVKGARSRLPPPPEKKVLRFQAWSARGVGRAGPH